MEIDFSVTKNYDKGIRIHKKNDEFKTSERLTFVVNKYQRSILVNHSQKNNITISDIVRIALSKYFERIE